MSCLLESFLGSLLFWLPSLSLISLAVMFRFSPTSGLSDGLGEVLELEEGLTEELTEELDWRLGCLWTGVTSGVAAGVTTSYSLVSITSWLASEERKTV